ncbi:hypothetical protein SDC9_104367 [bioreactor metagenome]|uniref:Uncharacterized protein n=1 Tax=bioreactor metagenome TaxID=1076179 RepID=A0A645AWC3_9ZZZZ|nr:hypothetical protein [Cloacibacillus evryensis]MEA5034219.1 hypothetical protein [Cloacibacillus evryensis]
MREDEQVLGLLALLIVAIFACALMFVYSEPPERRKQAMNDMATGIAIGYIMSAPNICIGGRGGVNK